MANIQHLAPELLIQILSVLETPEDLRSLVSASSACFRAYSSYQRPILLSALGNALSPELFRELLAIQNVPRAEPHDGWERVTAFYDHYFSEQPFELPLDPTNANVASLLRTYFTVERQIRIYFPHAYAPFLLVDRNRNPDEEKPKFIPLSVAERGRLRRAFYRYELYSRVFSQDPVEFGNAMNNTFCAEYWQYEDVICRMTPFEVEELSCIYLFLVTVTGGFVEDLEDEVFDAVISCRGARGVDGRHRGPLRGSMDPLDQVEEAFGPRRVKLSSKCCVSTSRKRKRSPSPPSGTYSSRCCPTDDISPGGYLSFGCASLDHYGLDMFRGEFAEEMKPRFISRLASLGLDFILQLIDAPSATHRRFLIQSQPLVPLGFLPTALALGGYYELMPEGYYRGGRGIPEPVPVLPRDIDVRDGLTEDQQRIPSQFFSDRGSGRYLEIFNTRADILDILWDRLRAIGYLFWDKVRLDSPAAQRTMIMSWHSSSLHHREARSNGKRWFSKRKSVEERLKGVSIPAENMMRIAKEFGVSPAVRIRACPGNTPWPPSKPTQPVQVWPEEEEEDDDL
ncbi:hypothetical protein V8F20_011046 [Naviculisporaceae sp. PSN 640]